MLLANDEERLVVEGFCDRLTDVWLIVPNVGVTGRHDRQMDIVIAHTTEGAAVVVVKGHRVRIERGLWCCDGQALAARLGLAH